MFREIIAYVLFLHTIVVNNRVNIVFVSILFAASCCYEVKAQNTMRINYKDGSVYDTPIEQIDSITFIDKNTTSQEIALFGTWMWGSAEAGYYELLTFNEDKTYIGYDYYVEYGFDTYTYGTYSNNGIMLNLRSNGYGYSRMYRWFITGLTDNALKVMTQMGNFVYYRVHPKIITMNLGDYIECEDDDYFVFADGIKVLIQDNKLLALTIGTTYIQRYNATTNCIYAYKVIVE